MRTLSLAIASALVLMSNICFAYDPFVERTELLKTSKAKDAISIGIFPGTVSLDVADIYALMSRYIPLSNYLSKESGKLVSFVPEKNVQVFKRRVSEKQYPFVYCNAEIAVSAALAGYVPIAKRKDNIASVFVTKADSKLSKVEELKGKSVGVVEQAMVSTLAKYSIAKANLWGSVKLVDAGGTGTAGLLKFLDNGTAEVVVLRKETADEIIAKEPGKYRVAIAAEVAPGFILMARPGISVAERTSFARAFLDLTDASQRGQVVLAGLDGVSSRFEPAGTSDIEPMVKFLEILSPLEPGKNYIVKAKKS